MRYSATIHVTDVMDLVVVQVQVQAWDGCGSAPEVIAERTWDTQGLGEDDPARWLSGALRSARLA